MPYASCRWHFCLVPPHTGISNPYVRIARVVDSKTLTMCNEDNGVEVPSDTMPLIFNGTCFVVEISNRPPGCEKPFVKGNAPSLVLPRVKAAREGAVLLSCYGDLDYFYEALENC
jgi:hypothetical protein